MRHFVAYHKVAEWGEYEAPDEFGELAHYSGHRTSRLEQCIGQIVWVISGERSNGNMVYSLCAIYTPDRLEVIPEGGHWVVGQGQLISPAIPVTGQSWFVALKQEQGNFSLGFNEIRSAETIQCLYQAYDNSAAPTALNEQAQETEQLIEGTRSYNMVSVYERNLLARIRCIEHYGYNCWVCGFNFEQKYGKIGRNYIHVHHITPLSVIGETYVVDPIRDLRPVCPNCHAMLHRSGADIIIEELRNLLQPTR